MQKRRPIYWAVQWRQKNKLDGVKRHWVYPLLRPWVHRSDGSIGPVLFITRRECQAYIRERYGYIAKRKDLRIEPHCWRVPTAVRVELTLTPVRAKK